MKINPIDAGRLHSWMVKHPSLARLYALVLFIFFPLIFPIMYIIYAWGDIKSSCKMLIFDDILPVIFWKVKK